MKYLNKIVTFILIPTLMFATVFPSFASSEAFSYTSEAKVLNDLGLYNGISSTTFDPDLGTALNRETGIVMLIRLFGLEAQAQAISDVDADAVLAPFTDSDNISNWAKKQVAYAIKNNIVKGVTPTSIGPQGPLVGKAYCTLILRQLGFDPVYSNAVEELADKGGLSQDEVSLFQSKELVKDDLVGISFGTLSATDKGGKTVINNLIDQDILGESEAIDAGLAIPQQQQPFTSSGSGSSHSNLSTNANLKSLSLNNVQITPAFYRDITIYVANVGYDTSSITVTSEVYEQNATVKTNNTYVGHGGTSDPINLALGLNTVTAAVYAQNGVEKDYIININRLEVSSAEIIGPSCIRIKMYKDLLSVSSVDAFTVKFNDEDIPIENITIDGDSIYLNLQGLVSHDELIVDYQQTGENDLTYSDNVLVSNFTDLPTVSMVQPE